MEIDLTFNKQHYLGTVNCKHKYNIIKHGSGKFEA